MACPVKVKSFAVSRTMSPVTQTADVDVKRASINEMPCTVAVGSLSSKEPARIRIRKLAINCCTGDILPKILFLISIKKFN